MVWLCMNVVSAPWSHSGSKGLDTMMWSSMDSTWRDSNSLLHMSLLTCSETGKTRWRCKERRWIDRDDGYICVWAEVYLLLIFIGVTGLSCYRASIPGLLQLWTEKHLSIFFFLAFIFYFFTVLRIAHCESVWMRSVQGYNTYDMQYMWECVSVTFLLPSYMDQCSCGETWSAPKALKFSHSSKWRRSGPG